MPKSLAVFVEHFIFPPTEQFVNSIQRVLTDNYGEFANHVSSGRNAPKDLDIAQCVRYGVGQAERLIQAVPNVLMAASIVPLIIEVQSGVMSRQQGLIFVSARNHKGHEWVYAHFVGKIVAPVEVTHMLADSVNGVLEERLSLEADPSVEEMQSVSEFIDVIVNSVTHVLGSQNKTRRLDS